MGNLCMRFTSKTSQQNVVLLLLGLDNAGKTVIANRLRKEDFTNVLPTIGFSMQNLNYDKHMVFLYELGGSEQIRNIWPKYYLDAHGLIFVVDSSDLQRLAECQHILNEVVCHKQINGKPILIFANKQDCEGALDEIDIVEKLGIEDMVNKYQCPTLVQPCSAVRLPDPNENIESGYNWLLTYIHRNYTRINNRVIADTKSQQEQDIKVKKPSKTKQQKIMNGCFGDSWVSKNIEECPSTPKRTFLLNALANPISKNNARRGSCIPNESRFAKADSIKIAHSNRRIKSAMGYVNYPKSYKKMHEGNKKNRSKYSISSLCQFRFNNKVGIIE